MIIADGDGDGDGDWVAIALVFFERVFLFRFLQCK